MVATVRSVSSTIEEIDNLSLRRRLFQAMCVSTFVHIERGHERPDSSDNGRPIMPCAPVQLGPPDRPTNTPPVKPIKKNL